MLHPNPGHDLTYNDVFMVPSLSDVPSRMDVDLTTKLPDDAAATAYYVVNEAVANILKHARARTASVRVVEDPVDPLVIRITVHDDGRGGAEPANGTGLAGIRARVEGADGTLLITRTNRDDA